MNLASTRPPTPEGAGSVCGAPHRHFAAWEEPQLFSEELRAAFRTVR
jgi:hypothetical protein